MTQFPVVDVDGWALLNVEPMGSKPDKLWLEAPPEGGGGRGPRWLFKPATVQYEAHREFPKGDDWAEKIVGEVARVLTIPAAAVELARRGDRYGAISRDVSEGRDLVLGNVILHWQDPRYERDRRHEAPGYTVEGVLAGLRGLAIAAPAGTVEGIDACATFAGYLLLDALVANTDRHHENWGVLEPALSGGGRELAPSFDHASSLGFQLSDEERQERLGTRDSNRTVEAFARRGMSRHFSGRPSLVSLAAQALGRCDQPAGRGYVRAIEGLSPDSISELVESVPPDRMSQPARMFAGRLMVENRRRILDAVDRAG